MPNKLLQLAGKLASKLHTDKKQKVRHLKALLRKARELKEKIDNFKEAEKIIDKI